MSAHPVTGPSSFARVGRVTPSEIAGEDDARPADRRRSRWSLVAAGLLVAFAAWQLGAAGWVHAKALLAQHLIAESWKSARAGGVRKPWPWADTRPVARLSVPSRGVDLFVLSGASGQSLAFGPGHVDGTAMPGSGGNSVIVAHRDTHFAFLKDLDPQAEISVEDAKGRVTRYRVRETAIVDKSETRLLDAADSPQLTLITCWPFDAVAPGTPLRYVVIADRVA